MTARGIEKEPAFTWWVPYTLRKHDIIVSSVSSRVRRCLHKYGIEVPKLIVSSKNIDERNGYDFRDTAINKKMTNIGIDFSILSEGEKDPVGWIKASDHLVFDVNMDFTRKARWVKDGHRTPDPTTSSYVGVVSRESV